MTSMAENEFFSAFLFVTIVSALGVLVGFALPCSCASTHHHDSDDGSHHNHHAESNSEHHSAGEIHLADLSAYADIKDLVALNLAGSILASDDLQEAIIAALSNEETGPLVLTPMIQMLCAALQEDPSNTIIGCDPETAVKAVQQSASMMNFFEITKNPFAAFDILDNIIHNLAPEHTDEAFGYEGVPKLSELAAKKLEASAANSDFQTEFVARLEEIFEAGKEKVAAMDLSEAPTGISLVQGYLRLFLTDRELEKAIFEAACENHDIHAHLGGYFATKYGLMEKHEAEEIVHDTIRAILNDWEDRKVIFGLMKSAYAKLTGKKIPIGFNFYDGLVQGIKSGEIELPAVLGYLEMAHVNPSMIKALQQYDAKAFGRIKYLYVPAYKFVREYFMEHPGSIMEA